MSITCAAPEPTPWRRLRRSSLALWAAASATLCLGLSACSSTPKPPQIDAERLRQFEARAYPAPHQFETTQSEELRVAEGTPMRLIWLRPQAPGPLPLLVYMPGAGQDALAFGRWRRALAQAGYVVLSWQPLPDDDHLPGAQGAARAELYPWAARRFGAGMLARRAALLTQLMTELARAQAAGEASLQGVDLGRAALAGYELGAYTTQLVSGEHVRGVPDAAGRWPFKAFIAISPHVSFEQGGFDTRYRDVHGAVLSLTSDADADGFGLGSAAYLRRAPFGGMPAGNKYLLVLRGLPHALLGGREGPERIQAPADESPDKRGEQGSSHTNDGGERNRRGSGNRRESDRAAGTGTPAGPERAVDPSAALTLRAMQQSALGTVTVAFLDACVQDDTLARDWLAGPAAKWLASIGDWQHK